MIVGGILGIFSESLFPTPADKVKVEKSKKS
jgi:hypothetical protein